MFLKNYASFRLSCFFFNPLSYTDFLNGPFRQIMCFSITHLWFSPERLVLLFINDNGEERTVNMGV